MGTVSVSVKIDLQVRERIRRLAETRRRSAHCLMREAIRQYVEREEERDALLRRGEEAWRHYRDTGLHVTGQEVVDWLSTWGDQGEAAPPTCRR